MWVTYYTVGEAIVHSRSQLMGIREPWIHIFLFLFKALWSYYQKGKLFFSSLTQSLEISSFVRPPNVVKVKPLTFVLPPTHISLR
jgi:hypothetical protein